MLQHQGKSVNNDSKLKKAEEAYETILQSNDIYYQAMYTVILFCLCGVTDYVKTHGIGNNFVADLALRKVLVAGTVFYGGWG